MDGESDDHRRAEAAVEAARKLDEHNAELSGVASGRIARYLPEGHADRPKSEARRIEKAKAQLSALEALLANDPLYRAAHRQAFRTLQEMETRTEQALVSVRASIGQASELLDEMRGRGSDLPDGRKVYRDADGNARTEDGDLIEGPELDGVIWREDAPSYEEIKAQQDRLADLRRREEDLLAYQTNVLGHARDQLTDEDNPPDREGIERLDRLMKEQAPEALSTPENRIDDGAGQPTFKTDMPKL